jgi:hypothetical protein
VIAKIDAGGRHSGGGGARAVRSGDGSRCPGTKDVRVSGEHKEERRARATSPVMRNLHGRQWPSGKGLHGGGACAREGDAGMHRRGKGARKDSCSCFIGQEKGRGAIAKAKIAKDGHGGRP